VKTIEGSDLRRRNERDQGLTVTGRVGPSPLVSLKWLRRWLRRRGGAGQDIGNSLGRNPGDSLIGKLETREQSHPRHVRRVEIQRPVPERAVDVGATDRRSTGEQLAKQLRMTYVDFPERLTGRVVACPANAAGREYIQIVDAARARFTLVLKPPRASSSPHGKPCGRQPRDAVSEAGRGSVTGSQSMVQIKPSWPTKMGVKPAGAIATGYQPASGLAKGRGAQALSAAAPPKAGCSSQDQTEGPNELFPPVYA
jgi:hypothetical protein